MIIQDGDYTATLRETSTGNLLSVAHPSLKGPAEYSARPFDFAEEGSDEQFDCESQLRAAISYTREKIVVSTGTSVRRSSILPNSNAEILGAHPFGFRILWNDARDTHCLYIESVPIAEHNNGFSCYELLKRILAGNVARAVEQLDYIKSCGGVCHMSAAELKVLV